MAASLPNPNILETLLRKPRFYPGAVKSLEASISNNHLENVKILLKDERIDPTYNSGLLTDALGDWRILELLLNDGRVHPSYSNYVVYRRAATLKRDRFIRVLLNDDRTNKYSIFLALLVAIKNKNKGIVKLLLKDKRCDPTMQKNEAINKSLSPEITKILLSHPKVRPTYTVMSRLIMKNDFFMIKKLIDEYPDVCKYDVLAVAVVKPEMLKFLWEMDKVRKNMTGIMMRIILDVSKGRSKKYLQTLLPEIEQMERLETLRGESTYLFWNKFRTHLKEKGVRVSTSQASRLYRLYQNSKNKRLTLVNIIKRSKSVLES